MGNRLQKRLRQICIIEQKLLLLKQALPPVPGGVGPVTIIKLIEQTIEAAEKKFSL